MPRISVVKSISSIYTFFILPSSRHGIIIEVIITMPPIVGTPFLLTLKGSVFESRCTSEMLCLLI